MSVKNKSKILIFLLSFFPYLYLNIQEVDGKESPKIDHLVFIKELKRVERKLYEKEKMVLKLKEKIQILTRKIIWIQEKHLLEKQKWIQSNEIKKFGDPFISLMSGVSFTKEGAGIPFIGISFGIFLD